MAEPAPDDSIMVVWAPSCLPLCVVLAFCCPFLLPTVLLRVLCVLLCVLLHATTGTSRTHTHRWGNGGAISPHSLHANSNNPLLDQLAPTRCVRHSHSYSVCTAAACVQLVVIVVIVLVPGYILLCVERWTLTVLLTPRSAAG